MRMNLVSVRTIEGWGVEGKLSLGLLLMRERDITRIKGPFFQRERY